MGKLIAGDKWTNRYYCIIEWANRYFYDFRTLNDLLLKNKFKNNNVFLCKRCKENRREWPPDCDSDGVTLSPQRFPGANFGH